MAEIPARLTAGPKDLDWLTQSLKLSMPQNPALKTLLEGLPNIYLETWPAGSEVVREGERSEDFFVVYDGELTVRREPVRGPARVLGTLKPGDFFGEIGFLMKSARSATVRAETPCRLFRFSSAEFQGLLQRHRILEDWVEQVACERIEKLFY